MLERDVQREIVDNLRHLGARVYVTSMHRAISSGAAGIPDVLAIFPDRVLLFVECKRERGQVSPEQVDFLEAVRGLPGVRGVVARSWEEVEQVLVESKVIRR